MLDSFRPLLLWRRAILLLLMGLLLPLQSSLAYARSLAMLTSTQTESATVLMSVKTMTTAIDHHHASKDTDGVMEHESSSEHHHVTNAVKPCHSEAPAGNQNHDCAKCCLIGAAAPPSSAVHTQSLVMARQVFITTSNSLSGFIPDGLERPPRA
jgi:hypothetical protein